MAKLSVLTWIGNAAAVLFGRHGDVSAQATDAGCSRQAAYDHADQVEQAVADARLPGPSRQQLLDDNRSLRQQLEQRRAQHQAERRVDLGKDKQRQLATTAWAMGLSLGQIKDLLGLLLPAGKAPGRSTLGRWVLAAARRAGPVLRVLDAACAPRAQVLCPDEIFFHGRPVLVAVEPTSMALLLCQKAKDRQGPTWQQALRPFTHLEAVVRDAGTGLSAGLALLDQQRRATRGLAPLEDGLDLFHTEQCQGTRTFTRLGDTNRYEPDPQPRNARGHFSYFPVFPPHGSRPPLRAAASRPRHALPGLALSGPPRYAPHAG
jgi:hypothetical protein